MLRKKLVLLCLALGVATAELQAQAQPKTEQETLDLSVVQQLNEEYADKINAAFTAMEAVQKAGAYIESLSDLYNNGEITLPVGIKKGDYELIIQKITYEEKTDKAMVHASCAFKLKGNGQRIAFEGQALLQGQKGLGTQGDLALIAPIKIGIGKESAVIVQKGSKVNFSCDGVDRFVAKMTWLITSGSIVAVDSKGTPLGKPLSSSFETTFSNFDNYVVSLNIDQHFSVTYLKDVIFSIKGGVLDQSDVENSEVAKFPNKYFNSPEEQQLWRGLAIIGASVTLPPFLSAPKAEGQKDSIGGRITLALDSVLFDDKGFSGTTSYSMQGTQALPKDSWAVSLSKLQLSFFKNNLTALNFNGEMNIPPFGNSSLLPYRAAFNSSSREYDFIVNFAGRFDFPTIKSSLEVYQSSSVEIHFRGSDFYPKLNASGKLTINAGLGTDSTKTLSIPDITFENLCISRESPYLSIGAIGLSGDMKTPEIAGFSLSIDKLETFTSDNGGGLAFDAGIGLSDMFTGKTSLKLYGDYANWKFKKVEVERINVDFQSKSFSVNGGVWMKNGDNTYGSGFRGDVKFKLLDKFDLDAIAVFGKKNDFCYFLTDVFLEVPVSAGIKVAPGLSFYGFGGGLYRKMQQQQGTPASDFGKSLSGISYIPDKTVGMGFMASTKFALAASESGFNAKVGLEIQFNQHGGVNFVQLRGDASVMNMPPALGSMVNDIGAQVQQLDKAGGQLKEANKKDLGVPGNQKEAFLTASMLMKYDITNNVFAADLKAYLDAKGIIKGIGANSCMGWSSAYFASNSWHVYMGTPTDRVGIDVLGLAQVNGYFMLGDGIPSLPPPPEHVLKFLTTEQRAKLIKERSGDKLETGSGVAFGAGLDLAIKPTLPPFYASFALGLGSEFVLTNRRGVSCSNSNGTIGLNGWYAEAQAWGYVDGRIGMEAKVFGRKKSFDILGISAGTLLYGAGPNPMYFSGMVGGEFKVLGGLVKGKCKFDFEVGDKCKDMVGGSPFGEDIIAQLTPATGASEVNVFAVPQAVFNIPVGVEIIIDEEDGSKATYMVTLENFSLAYKEGSRPIALQQKLSADGTVCAIDPLDPFESRKEITAHAKVSFKKKVNGVWRYVNGDDGNPLFEEKTESFTSGERPKEFMPEHVKYAYPVARQYNFYPDEYKQGYVQLTENYEYLFTTEKPEGCNQLLRVTTTDGKKFETPFTYKKSNGEVKFEVNYSLEQVAFDKNQIYKLVIVNVPQNRTLDVKSNISASAAVVAGQDEVSITKQTATGTLAVADEKEIYAIHFRSSSYKTFAEKMAAVPNRSGVIWQEYPHVYNLISNVYDYTKPTEMFDIAEVAGVDAESHLVVAAPIYERTAWYTQHVAPLMYNARLLSDAGLGGLQPAAQNVVYIGNSSPKQLDDNMLNTGSRLTVDPWGAVEYRAAAFIDDDYCKIRNELANKVLSGARSPEAEAFFNSNHIPDMKNGQYPVRFSYKLPGVEKRITSSVEKVISVTGFID